MTERVDIDEFTYVTMDASGGIHVTQPNALGEMVTHRIDPDEKRPALFMDIAVWLFMKWQGQQVALIQDVFPNMKPEDREFLVTGITPEVWAKMFPKGDE